MRTLLTRDGRRIGNAILIKQTGLNHEGEPLYQIETDYGNRICHINQIEIETLFWPGKETSYERWSRDREQLRKQTCFDDAHTEPDPPETGIQIR